MNSKLFFIVDNKLIVSIAAAWLIEFALGSPGLLRKLPEAAARLARPIADGAVRLSERFGAEPPDAKSGSPPGGSLRGGGKAASVLFAAYMLLASFAVTAVLLDLARQLHPSFFYILNAVICSRLINTRTAANGALREARRINAIHGSVSGLRAGAAAGGQGGRINAMNAMNATPRASAAYNAPAARKTQKAPHMTQKMPHKTQKAPRSDTSANSETDTEAAAVWRVIEGLSKNCVEGVVAPILFIAAGALIGLPAAFAAAYRTLSAIAGIAGGDDRKYKNIGWAAVKLEYAVNFIPARLCAIVLPLAAPVCGAGLAGVRRGLRATRDIHSAQSGGSRDYAGGNGVWPAAAIAGVLNISPVSPAAGAAGTVTAAGAMTAAASGAAFASDSAAAFTAYNTAAGVKAPQKNTGMPAVSRLPVPGDINKSVMLMCAASFAAMAICCVALGYFAI